MASIIKFAPWVRHIYIVTDNQTPPFLRQPLPKPLQERITLIDHTTIFRGYEHILPVFSCRPIETVLWRIPDLAERFIYFNDDMALTQPVTPSDFFRYEKKLVLRGTWKPFSENTLAHKLKQTRLVRHLKNRKQKPQRASHIQMQELSARACGFSDWYFQLPHQPHPAFKSQHASLFESHPDWLKVNLSHKLRHPEQLWSFSLDAHDALTNNQAVIDNTLSGALVKPQRRNLTGLRLQLNRINRRANKAFVCIQNMDNANEAIQRTIIDWLNTTIGPLDTQA